MRNPVAQFHAFLLDSRFQFRAKSSVMPSNNRAQTSKRWSIIRMFSMADKNIQTACHAKELFYA
jgi:hypothetical protein